MDDSGIGSRYLDLGWPFIMQFVEHTDEMVLSYRSLWEILRFGMKQKDALWERMHRHGWQQPGYCHSSSITEQ